MKNQVRLQSGSLGFREGLGLFLISAATLTFEINLSRLFSVAQFYHFAFMIVSIALLGFGASGSFLAIFPGFSKAKPGKTLAWLAVACGLSMIGAYLLANWLPFDSFRIAWDYRQVYILIVHYLALAAPFFFSGMAVGLLLTIYPQTPGRTYAINLIGSALGCGLALIFPGFIGGVGTVVASSGLACLGVINLFGSEQYPLSSLRKDRAENKISNKRLISRSNILITIVTIAILTFTFFNIRFRLGGERSNDITALQISPYKALSYALQYPGARLIYQRWNAFSRVDLVRSNGIRSLPGLSYRYLGLPPPEDGLFVDGDEISPVVLPTKNNAYIEYLPATIAFILRPRANILILEPRGGLDITTAKISGARSITAVEVNPLIIEAAAYIYNQPEVKVINEADRSHLKKTAETYDLIILSLTTSYHPIRSGAYSLIEDYRYTVEAFEDILDHLNPEGIFVYSRWLQDPPSESLRAFGLGVTTLENSGSDPRKNIIAIRGYNTATFFIKKKPFSEDEISRLKEFANQRAFDLIYAPNIFPEETNRYNVLPASTYYLTFLELLNTVPRDTFYNTYPFDVTPPTDDHPFFGHYFKWSQAKQILAEIGKTWQPFGGAGYFVVLALLILATLLAILLILLPALVPSYRRYPPDSEGPHPKSYPQIMILYFGLIGIAYLLVEIPLIQRFILYLGQPAYAFTTVLFTLLIFSGLGSHLSHRISIIFALGGLVFLLVGTPAFLPNFFNLTLGYSLKLRLALTFLILAPIGFLMGIPFPSGISWMTTRSEYTRYIPWIWGVNGSTSVISAVLAALLAISIGFSWVFRLGALCYALALIMIWITARLGLAPPLRQ